MFAFRLSRVNLHRRHHPPPLPIHIHQLLNLQQIMHRQTNTKKKLVPKICPGNHRQPVQICKLPQFQQPRQVQQYLVGFQVQCFPICLRHHIFLVLRHMKCFMRMEQVHQCHRTIYIVFLRLLPYHLSTILITNSTNFNDRRSRDMWFLHAIQVVIILRHRQHHLRLIAPHLIINLTISALRSLQTSATAGNHQPLAVAMRNATS